MNSLKLADYPAAYKLYCSTFEFFPLIGSVLQNQQDGAVYTNNSEAPTQFYIEHQFGFAQLFGKSDRQFEAALEQRLLHQKNFAPTKVRLYTPMFPDFLKSKQGDQIRSERQRFALPSNWITKRHTLQIDASDINLTAVDEANIKVIETQFGVVSRFWRNGDDFISQSGAVIAWSDNEPVAICYASALASECAEIDVLTLPEYRHKNLGKKVAVQFCINCIEKGIKPVWDCFTNNIGSMSLCRSIGFVPSYAPYPFFTFNRT